MLNTYFPNFVKSAVDQHRTLEGCATEVYRAISDDKANNAIYDVWAKANGSFVSKSPLMQLISRKVEQITSGQLSRSQSASAAGGGGGSLIIYKIHPPKDNLRSSIQAIAPEQENSAFRLEKLILLRNEQRFLDLLRGDPRLIHRHISLLLAYTLGGVLDFDVLNRILAIKFIDGRPALFDKDILLESIPYFQQMPDEWVERLFDIRDKDNCAILNDFHLFKEVLSFLEGLVTKKGTLLIKLLSIRNREGVPLLFSPVKCEEALPLLRSIAINFPQGFIDLLTVKNIVNRSMFCEKEIFNSLMPLLMKLAEGKKPPINVERILCPIYKDLDYLLQDREIFYVFLPVIENLSESTLDLILNGNKVPMDPFIKLKVDQLLEDADI